jgi:hypothetical protein
MLDKIQGRSTMEDIVSDDKKNDDGVIEKKDVVAYETYQRLLDQRKADQAKLKTFEEKEAELERQRKELEESKLKDEGNWKALLEAREEKLIELANQKTEYENKVLMFEQQFQEAAKLQALQEAIGGKFKHKSYYNLVDTDKIIVNPESGEIDQDSVKKYADSFLKEHKELIAFSKPPVNDRAPGQSGSMTYEEWLVLAKTDPKKAKEKIKEVKR